MTKKTEDSGKAVEVQDKVNSILAEEVEIVAPVQTNVQVQNPSSILAIAVEKGAEVDQLTKLYELQVAWEANEARKAFHAAKAAFMENPPVVIKDMINKQYESRYASIGRIVNTVSSSLSKYGLSTSWTQKESDNNVTVTCILTHKDGHSEKSEMSGPPDESGKKNAIQQRKSTVTYLRVTTFESVTGIIASNDDDDGNAGGGAGGDSVSQEQIEMIRAVLKDNSFKEDRLLKFKRVASIEDIISKDFDSVIAAIEKAGNS